MAWWDDVADPNPDGDDPYVKHAGVGVMPDPWDVATRELDSCPCGDPGDCASACGVIA